MSRLARACAALFVANGVAVVLIWWAGLDQRTFGSLAGILNAFGRITGLVGTYLVLVQLILRTHVPWLVRAFGKDDLKRWHTWNGYIAFSLLGVHGVFQIAGYSLQDRVDLWTELGLLLAHYEGMVLAFGSLALLAALTVLALGPIRHRMPWPTWRALHLYTYVAIALSVPHMIATGSDFIDAPLAVAYWTGLEAVVALILVAARVPPLWRAATATGRPHPAIVAVGALVIAVYLLGSVRLSPTDAALATISSAPDGAAGPPPSPTASGTRPAPSSPIAATALAVEGQAVDTPYGPAQVRVILSGGHITDVEPMMLPAATKRSKTISGSAEFWLRKRAIAAQSAEFEVLSGATYTSRAYMASLDTALRAAGVAKP